MENPPPAPVRRRARESASFDVAKKTIRERGDARLSPGISGIGALSRLAALATLSGKREKGRRSEPRRVT